MSILTTDNVPASFGRNFKLRGLLIPCFCTRAEGPLWAGTGRIFRVPKSLNIIQGDYHARDNQERLEDLQPWP